MVLTFATLLTFKVPILKNSCVKYRVKLYNLAILDDLPSSFSLGWLVPSLHKTHLMRCMQRQGAAAAAASCFEPSSSSILGPRCAVVSVSRCLPWGCNELPLLLLLFFTLCFQQRLSFPRYYNAIIIASCYAKTNITHVVAAGLPNRLMNPNYPLLAVCGWVVLVCGLRSTQWNDKQ
jgi:hypothetical protein